MTRAGLEGRCFLKLKSVLLEVGYIKKWPALLKEIFDASIIINSVNAPGHRITLKLLKDSKAITKTMASKIAKSGLNYEHLKIAFERSGYDGLAAVLGEKVNGVVTKHGKITQKIFEHFTQLQT